MRTQPQILAQVHDFADAQPRVRAVLLNGSRTNPAHAPDLLSDYDLLFSVTDVASFAADERWLAHFGDVLIMQRPTNPPPQWAWLVVFGDGVRIDFTLSPTSHIVQDARADSLTVVLIDKDGIAPSLDAPSESSHLVEMPDPFAFSEACNEFWWVLLYAAKGLWREQIPYARHAFECIVRPELERMLVWYAVSRRGARNPGSFNKHLATLLPESLWAAYLRTYAGADVDESWNALEAAAAIMDEVAPQVAVASGCRYDRREGENALRLLRALRNLPADAEAIL